MALTLLVILAIFWFLGYGPLTALKVPLVTLGKFSINLWDIFIFLIIIWLIDLLPGPIRSIVVIALLVWLLASFGFIAFPGLNNLVMIAIIVGLGLYVISGK